MNIKGGVNGQPGNPMDANDEGVFISKINPGGIAIKDNRLSVGQRIIEVNGQSLLGATHTEAVNVLRNAGNSIAMVLCDGFKEENVPINGNGIHKPSSEEEGSTPLSPKKDEPTTPTPDDENQKSNTEKVNAVSIF